jgi:hypothetical protein
MFAWIRRRRQRAHLAEVARILEAENDRLRQENARMLHLVRLLRDVNADLDRRLTPEAQP